MRSIILMLLNIHTTISLGMWNCCISHILSPISITTLIFPMSVLFLFNQVAANSTICPAFRVNDTLMALLGLYLKKIK